MTAISPNGWASNGAPQRRTAEADQPVQRCSRINLALLILTAVFLPLLVPHGPGNTAPVDLFIVLYMVAAIIGLFQRGRGLVIPLLWVVLLLAGASIVATVVSEFPKRGISTMFVDFYLFALFVLICNDLRRDRAAIRMVIMAWGLSALFWATLSVGTQFHFLPHTLQNLISQSSREQQRASATTKNPNLAASYFVLSFFAFLSSPIPRHRLLRIAGGVWIALAIYASGSLGGLFSFAFGCILIVFASYLRRSGDRYAIKAVVATLLIILGGFGLVLMFLGIYRGSPLSAAKSISKSAQSGGPFQHSIGRLNKSFSGRVLLWKTALEHSTAIDGVGPGESKYTVDYKGLHDDFLAYLIERGIVGFLGLLIMLALLWRWAIGLLLAGGPSGTGLQAIAIGVIANTLFGLTHQTLHFRHVWLLFALIWCCYDLLKQRRELGLSESDLLDPPPAPPLTTEPLRVPVSVGAGAGAGG